MSALQKIPEFEQAVTAKEAAPLWQVSPDYFLRTYACKPSFPEPVGLRPLAWKLGELLEWRDANRPQRRRRSAR